MPAIPPTVTVIPISELDPPKSCINQKRNDSIYPQAVPIEIFFIVTSQLSFKLFVDHSNKKRNSNYIKYYNLIIYQEQNKQEKVQQFQCFSEQ